MNELSGPLEQTVVDRWPRMYDLDLSFNQLTGEVPTFGANHDQIRLLRLNNNRFSGELTEQLAAFGAHQDRRATSLLNVANNRFTGALPETFRTVLTDAHPVHELYADGNHFRCEGPSGQWPRWVARVQRTDAPGSASFGPYRFGKCARVPEVHSATNPKIGQALRVSGAFF